MYGTWMCVRSLICTLHLYGDLLIHPVDLYSEEHAVVCLPDKQTQYAGNGKPSNSGICNPHIPIKAPQVYQVILSCTVSHFNGFVFFC